MTPPGAPSYGLGDPNGPPPPNPPDRGPWIDDVCISLSCDGTCGSPSHVVTPPPPTGGPIPSWMQMPNMRAVPVDDLGASSSPPGLRSPAAEARYQAMIEESSAGLERELQEQIVRSRAETGAASPQPSDGEAASLPDWYMAEARVVGSHREVVDMSEHIRMGGDDQPPLMCRLCGITRGPGAMAATPCAAAPAG